MNDWRFFQGNGKENHDVVKELENLKPPPWRRFSQEKDIYNNQRWEKLINLVKEKDKRRGKNFRIPSNATEVIDAVNAAIYLRRPLLITGKPGSGKTSLAYAIANELKLGPVLCWSITTRTSLQDGLYRYDAIARLQDANLANSKNKLKHVNDKREEEDIGKYITLGALGTAFLPAKLPRVLLIDEIDKSDINLPNDLLNIFEEGEFQIPELVRASKSPETENSESQEGLFKVNTQDKGIDAVIKEGWVRCHAFPIIVMTSNGEKDFPPAFKRRCIRVEMPNPNQEQLQNIVEAHFQDEITDFKKAKSNIEELITEFCSDKNSDRATDQLLNTIYLLTRDVSLPEKDINSIKEILFRDLSK